MSRLIVELWSCCTLVIPGYFENQNQTRISSVEGYEIVYAYIGYRSSIHAHCQDKSLKLIKNYIYNHNGKSEMLRIPQVL